MRQMYRGVIITAMFMVENEKGTGLQYAQRVVEWFKSLSTLFKIVVVLAGLLIAFLASQVLRVL